MHFRPFHALPCAIALMLPATASGATQLGQTPLPTLDCQAQAFAWHTSAPYVAPTAGVITQLRGTAGTGGATVSLKVIRPTPATVLATTAPLTVPAPGAIVSADVRVPVQQGDALGAWYGNDTTCGVPGTASDTYSVAATASDPPAGPITGEILTDGAGARFSFAARLEADADGDGFGDESQDSCPADPTTSAGPCEADAHLTATATPASIELGDVAVLDMSVAAPPGTTVRAAALTAALPAGLESVLVTPRSCAFAAAFTCPLGDIAGGSREAALVIRGTQEGTYAVPVSLASLTPDANPADNAASVSITVGPADSDCRVPKLVGRTRAVARALIKAAGCRLGTVKRKTVRTGRNGRVRKQSVKAGTTVPAGTKVGITLNRRR